MLFLLVISLFVSNSINSQEYNYKFKHLTEKDGLPNGYIHAILQDSKGFMWFGSEEGLIRYDGYAFMYFKYSAINPNSQIGDNIRSIVEDKYSNLWMGSVQGLTYYNRLNDNFYTYQYDPKDSTSINTSCIYSVKLDDRENLWAGSCDSGLLYLDVKTHKFKRFMHHAANENSISSNHVQVVYLDSKKTLWVGFNEGIIDILEKGSTEFKHLVFLDEQHHPITDQIRDIYEYPDGSVWVGTSGSGLYKVKVDKDRYIIEKHFVNNPDGTNCLTNNFISCIATNKEGKILIGTENGGLNFLNPRSNTFSHVTYDKFNDSGLSHQSVWSILVDSFNNVWVCTFATGINIHLNQTNHFNHYYNILSNNKSLNNNTVPCFCEDHQGNLWVGTDGGGLNLFDKKHNTFTSYNRKNSNISSDAILSVLDDHTGQLWVATWAGGVNVLNRETGKFTQYNKENSGLSCNNIIALCEDHKGVLWAGTFWCDGGLNYLDRKTNKFHALTTKNSGLCDDIIYSLREDYLGNLWIGTNDGLSCLNKQRNHFDTYMHVNGDTLSISQGTVLAILESHDHSLWFGTADGLNKLNRATGKFKRYFANNGLPNSHIVGIEEDNKGQLWISTENGLSCFNPVTEKFINYSVSDGLQNNHFFRCSHYKTSDGALLFGGINGFNMFYPDQIKGTIFKPKIYLTNFRIFNRSVKAGNEDSPLKENINLVKKIVLHYSQNSFSFEFAAVNYKNPEDNRYAYKLEGFDKQWINNGNNRTATYTNLDPGIYTFKVILPYNNGVENKEGISILVEIIPPFWMTLWFRIIGTVAIMGLVLFMVYYRLARIRRINTLLEKTVDEKTMELIIRNNEIEEKNQILEKQSDQLHKTNALLIERQREIENKNEMLSLHAEQLNETNAQLEERQVLIEEQSEELTVQKDEIEKQRDSLTELNITKDKLLSILSHDLRSPFNAILGYSELLYRNAHKYSIERIEQHAAMIRDTANHTFNLLNNLLEWTRSQRGLIQLMPVPLDMTHILENELQILREQSAQKEVYLTYNCIGKEILIEADPNLIATVIRNLISNAIKFSNKKNTVHILLNFQPDQFVFSVRDEGIGISDDEVKNLFKFSTTTSTQGTSGEKGSGLGLLMCADFIEKHHGKLGVTSEEGKGSTFSFSIPIKQISTLNGSH